MSELFDLENAPPPNRYVSGVCVCGGGGGGGVGGDGGVHVLSPTLFNVLSWTLYLML